MRSRSAAILGLAVFWMMLLALPASAGGSSLDVVNTATLRLGRWSLDYTTVASAVTLRGRFSKGQLSPVSAGPWYAYLTPYDGGDRSEPILLAPIDIIQTSSHSYAASVTFTAPLVPTGHYAVQACDLGCHVVGVGDLVGGNLVIGATKSEARVFARSQIMRWRHATDVHTIRSLTRQREGLRSEVSTSAREVEEARSVADHAMLRAERADAEAADAARQHGVALEDAGARVTVWRAIAATLLIMCLALASIVVLSRRDRIRVPDTPGELIADNQSSLSSAEADPDSSERHPSGGPDVIRPDHDLHTSLVAGN